MICYFGIIIVFIAQITVSVFSGLLVLISKEIFKLIWFIADVCTSISNPCLNGASCKININSTISCSCLNGWFGNLCQNCNSASVCMNNGVCDQVEHYCVCQSGYGGNMCEIRKIFSVFRVFIKLIVFFCYSRIV